MNKGAKIGLFATLTAVGAGVYFAFLSKNKKGKTNTTDISEKNKLIKKLVDKEREDNFISLSNQRIQASIQATTRLRKDQLKEDLKTFGIEVGLIDVSTDENSLKEEKKLYNNITKIGSSIAFKSIPKLLQPKSTLKKRTSLPAYQSYLQKEFSKTQVSIANSSNEEKLIRLWGVNSSETISPPAPEDVEDHEIITNVTIPINLGVGVRPQGMAFNPKNGFAYVANQLSNNVTVIDNTGQVVAVVQLQPSILPGFNSPVAIAVNSNTSSSNYGKVYVVGSVADTISVIDSSHTVTNEINIGARPIAIAFNPVNDQLYVSNFAANNVSVIDTTTEAVSTTLAVGNAPIGVGVNSSNGDIYITNSIDNSVSVFDSGNSLITTIAAVGTNPVSATYHPLNNEMFIVASDSNNIFPIDATNHTLGTPIATGNSPYTSIYNSSNEFIYVGNQDDNTFTIIATNHSVRSTISIGGNINIGFVLNPSDNQLFVSDTISNTVNIIGYAAVSSSITINDGYYEKAQNFLHNPAIVKHIKWVLSGNARFKILQFVEETPTGLRKSTPVSHENYKSPQNYSNVSEMTDLEGTMIDGKTSWVFKIGGLQTITFIVYYRQFQFQQFIPQKIAV